MFPSAQDVRNYLDNLAKIKKSMIRSQKSGDLWEIYGKDNKLILSCSDNIYNILNELE